MNNAKVCTNSSAILVHTLPHCIGCNFIEGVSTETRDVEEGRVLFSKRGIGCQGRLGRAPRMLVLDLIEKHCHEDCRVGGMG